ncbi:MAG: hypothetical protein ACR2H3_13355 [Acidimicrobiales bacterium]
MLIISGASVVGPALAAHLDGAHQRLTLRMKTTSSASITDG